MGIVKQTCIRYNNTNLFQCQADFSIDSNLISLFLSIIFNVCTFVYYYVDIMNFMILSNP